MWGKGRGLVFGLTLGPGRVSYWGLFESEEGRQRGGGRVLRTGPRDEGRGDGGLVGGWVIGGRGRKAHVEDVEGGC